MQLTYRTESGYQLPNLIAPPAPALGKYGMLRRSYLREQRNGIYTGLMLSGRLDSHLMETDRQAHEMVEQLTEQMAARQGVDEALKAADPIRWTGMMNNLKASAEEIVMQELICI